MKENFEERQSSNQRNSQANTPVSIVEEREISEVQPGVARSTKELQAEAEAHSPRRETDSQDADRMFVFKF